MVTHWGGPERRDAKTEKQICREGLEDETLLQADKKIFKKEEIKNKQTESQVWWYAVLTSALGRLRQKTAMNSSLGYRLRSTLA